MLLFSDALFSAKREKERLVGNRQDWNELKLFVSTVDFRKLFVYICNGVYYFMHQLE
jgi:hypothetical protein